LRSISVDEFQDIDEQQYRLLRLLAPNDENVCLIGDPNQAIYGFRGADASCFARFQADYPRAKIVQLRRNYRSSGTIVAASAQVIGAGQGQSIAEVARGMRERIAIHAARSERAEAEFVVKTIEGLLGGHNFFSIDSGRGKGGDAADLSFADFAVLFRTDAQSAALVEALERSGMPFKKHSHAPLADGPEVRAILHELFDRPSEEPPADRLRAAADRAIAQNESLERMAVELALKRLTSVADASAREGVRFSDAVAVASEADSFDPRAERVSLLTLHAAKGLEFRVVFIVGLEDGILPLHWGASDVESDEERRLFYVGMTRAMDRLFLCRAEDRYWRGRTQALPPSPFLTGIEHELLKHERAEPRRRRDEDRQLKLF
jgi:DNA helicase-2/ATP-dependent DNA helicase PcrA